MKAIRILEYGESDQMELSDVERPSRASEELLVRVEYTALNRADILQREGHYPAPPGIRDDIPGLEYGGVVEEVGNQTRRFEVGDRVFGLTPGASYAEYLVVREDQCMPVPESLSLKEASAIPEVFFTAYDALVLQGNLTAGESVLIHAAGSGVGTAAVQIARVTGAKRIFGTASKRKLEKASELGMDVGIDYRNTRFEDVIDQEQPGGVQIILDVIGAEYWDQNIECLTEKGRMILVGLLGGARTEVDLSQILFGRARIMGTTMRNRRPSEKAEVLRKFEDRILPLFEQGRIKPVIDREFSLKDASDAHRYMEANKNIGKIVLSVNH